MISYIRHNSVFDLGLRSGVSSCVGLYKELDDIYSKYINPQVRVQYEQGSGTVDCMCSLSGKQSLGGTGAFLFENGLVSVTVDEDDNVTVAPVGSGGGGGGDVTVIRAADSQWSGDVNTVNEAGDIVRTTSFDSRGTDIYIYDTDEEDFVIVSAGNVSFVSSANPPIIYEPPSPEGFGKYSLFSSTITMENYTHTLSGLPSGSTLVSADKVILGFDLRFDMEENTFAVIVGNFTIVTKAIT